MSDKINKMKEKIKDFYSSLSNEEFKERLISAGFEIVEGKAGEIIFDEGDES